MPNADIQHYVIAKSRDGWSVTAEADALSDHATIDQARRHAQELVERDHKRGRSAEMVDLSREPASFAPTSQDD